MYDENNKYCQECKCPSCDLFRKEGCLEGEDLCARCGSKSRTTYCPWHPEENQQ